MQVEKEEQDDTYVRGGDDIAVGDVFVALTNAMTGTRYAFFVVHSFVKSSGNPRLQQLAVKKTDTYRCETTFEYGFDGSPVLPAKNDVNPKATRVDRDSGNLTIKMDGYKHAFWLKRYNPDKVYQFKQYDS